MNAKKRWGLLFAVVCVAALIAAPLTAHAVPTFKYAIGGLGAGDGQMNHPYGVTSDEMGYLYVADYGNNRIQKFTAEGAYVAQWGVFGTGDGQFKGPVMLTYSNRHIYATDIGNDRVQKFTTAGVFVTKWGSHGTSDTEFNQPVGIAADRQGNIFVVDRDNNCVKKFSPTGTFLLKFGTGPGTGPGQFTDAAGVAVAPDQTVWVTSDTRIQHFSNTGTYLGAIGGPGVADGHFAMAFGVALDAQGNMFVTDPGRERIQQFNNAGTFVTSWGTTGTANGQFDNPSQVAVDGSGIYVADWGNNRVQKFTLPAAKPVTRMGGSDRYEVAILMARTRFPAYKGIKHVIVACGEDRAMADPLCSAGLAGVFDAPVLLTRQGSLATSTRNALRSMRTASGPLKIHIIGGTGSMPTSVYNQIKSLNPGGTIDRIGGADRYAVSVNIAKRMKTELASQGKTAGAIMIINAENPTAFYDALSASAVSAQMHWPMIAVRKNSVPKYSWDALKTTWVGTPRACVSGPGYISSAVYTSTLCWFRMTASSSRSIAARDIARVSATNDWERVRHTAIANKLSDALTGGAFIGAKNGALLYANATTLPSVTSSFVRLMKYETQVGWVFGGPASISDGVKASYTEALNTP